MEKARQLYMSIAVCFNLIVMAACSATHAWVSISDIQTHGTSILAESGRWEARQLLYQVRSRVRLRRAHLPAHKEHGGLEEEPLPIFVVGLKHREEERLAKFLLKVRWYEDLHVVEAVDGRTLDPVGTMTSGEVCACARRTCHFHPLASTHHSGHIKFFTPNSAKVTRAVLVLVAQQRQVCNVFQVACFESHRKVWKRIIDEEYRQAIIMEDDADIDLSEHMRTIRAFLAEAPADWQLLYLGLNNPKVNRPRFPCMLVLRGMLCMSSGARACK
jgi:hypothetical protein